jgi:hypothetical protein
MAFLSFVLSMVLIVWGLLYLKYGQSLPTGEEDVDRRDSIVFEFLFGPPKADSFVYELLYGPPGGQAPWSAE